MTIADLDLIVDDYLRQLETALGALPTARRAQIITEIAEHVSQARSGLQVQDEASIRSLLERVGAPSEIAASALTEGAPIASQRRRQAKRRGAFAAGIAVLLVVIGVVIYLAQSGSNVRVPNVVGSTEAAAKRLLSGAGLQYSVALRPFGPEESGGPGTVIAQFPPGGTIEANGSPVTLDVKGITTVPSVTVPSVVGESITTAFRQLRASGLEGESSGTCTRGSGACELENQVVIAQYPFAGKSALIGSSVALDAQPPGAARHLGVVDGTLSMSGRTPGLAQPVAGTVRIASLTLAGKVESVHVALAGGFSRVLPAGSYELSGTVPASTYHSSGTCASREITVVDGKTTTIGLHCQSKP